MYIALAIMYNCSSDGAFGRGVVYFNWGWWLGKTKFMECDL